MDLSTDQLAEWRDRGFLVVRGLFAAEEVAQIRTRFEQLAAQGEPVEGYWEPDAQSDDPLKRYPRAMHPHRWDALSKSMMLHPGVGQVLRQLLGQPAVACQSMYYFKPPGAAGQALHQDNFYLAVQPQTCIAAWTAIDPASPENGGMYCVPGSDKLGVICPDPDSVRPGTNLVDPPKGMKAEPAIMQPGDTLFFGGSLIHGSGRNRSKTQWRRSFICHYMPADSTHVSEHYFPIYDFAGNEITYAAATAGGPCGEALAAIGNSYGVDAIIH